MITAMRLLRYVDEQCCERIGIYQLICRMNFVLLLMADNKYGRTIIAKASCLAFKSRSEIEVSKPYFITSGDWRAITQLPVVVHVCIYTVVCCLMDVVDLFSDHTF